MKTQYDLYDTTGYGRMKVSSLGEAIAGLQKVTNVTFTDEIQTKYGKGTRVSISTTPETLEGIMGVFGYEPTQGVPETTRMDEINIAYRRLQETIAGKLNLLYGKSIETAYLIKQGIVGRELEKELSRLPSFSGREPFIPSGDSVSAFLMPNEIPEGLTQIIKQIIAEQQRANKSTD